MPPGATVFLDSTASPSLGTTPLANVRVPSGDHTFIFQLTNHEEVSLRVSVRRRRETFRVVLRALGVIEISAGNPGANGATARVDGRMVGQGPLGSMPVRVTDLQPGHHQVRVEREGYVPFERWVDVSGVQVARIAAMLERAAPDTGSILVSGPDGAPVFLDGTPRGVAPTVIDNVTVGAHAVEVRAPGEPPFLREVTVLAGQRATVAPLVAPPGGTVHVIASVPGATIRIDGAEVGFSPVVRQGVSAGLHLVEATAEGYDPATRTVSVEDGQRHMVTIQLWSPR
ncbi:MAG: PEGA domain-containing protein [Sandaracinaceae bacterium]|nr:PEGA domain-containing protein [Sandaracinaceae bacterium]